MLEKKFGKKKTLVGWRPILGPRITRVMYADDIILFSKACTKDALVISECLDKYYTWLSQIINGKILHFFLQSHPNTKW